MTGGIRALLGAAIGAVLTLVAHPLSRPFLISAWKPEPVGVVSSLPGAVPRELFDEEPSDDVDYCLWMQVAAERLDQDRILSRKEIANCIAYADSAAAKDTNNAFWLQMLSVFSWQKGDRVQAVAALQKASTRTNWNDLQSKRLSIMHSEVQSRFGSPQSWQYGRIYSLRSQAPARQIVTLLRHLLDVAPLQDDNGRNIRFLVLENAALMMDNARSIADVQMARDIIERTYRPLGMIQASSQRQLLRYRNRFLELLGKSDRDAKVNPHYADAALTIFHKSESIGALYGQIDPSKNALRFSLLSILTGSISGALIAASAVGLFLWGIGALMGRIPLAVRAIQFPGTILLAVGLTMMTFTITQLPVAAMAIGGCALIAGLTPKHDRSIPPSDLGPLFALVTHGLAILFLGSLSAYFVYRSTAAHDVLESLSLIDEWSPAQSNLLGLSLLILATLLLAAPMWAFAQRIRTSVVLVNGLRSFGATVAVWGLLLGVVACPIAIYADRRLNDVLYELATNEPLHYYTEH